MNELSLASTSKDCGALGGPIGVAEILEEESPSPNKLTARNFILLYVVPFCKSEIIPGLVIIAGLNMFQVEPLLIEYS